MNEPLVLSRAHEVVLQNFSKDKYVCLRCGRRGDITTLFSGASDERCNPQFELASSGWVDETTEISK